ncbi:unnamed protein product, partial [Candidula unifasciata]
DPSGNKIKVVTNATSETSVVQDSLQLSDEPPFGSWVIEVSLVDAKETSSLTFEVSQYELPTFEVTVETQQYALISDELLTGTIKAEYTYGQPVKGFVEIHVGPDQGPDQCGVLPKSTQIGLEIQVTTPDGKPPVNKNITVSVYTTVNYQLTVPDQALYNVDQFTGTYGLPGQNLTLPASGLLAVNIEIPKNATSITIQATVGAVEVIKTVQKVFSPSNNYLQLSLENKVIKSGTTLTVNVAATLPVEKLFYKVYSRSSLVVSGVVDGNNRTSFTFELSVNSEFAPNSHLLAFILLGTQEIIADSLSFQVEGLFNNEVTVSFNKNQTEPNTEIILQGTAKPGSTIFFLAVDQSVLLLKTGNDITPEK